ncbi:MBL fold metallo-hydrolase [Kribbella shirazensis]|uniref:Glyoxylase-like metal-dependent hydrolase (Beta-lactamase superfamily II) n=1 Tax=Kribbella shirazensis TaxID=1105143 RepID=A0A7X6A2P5_9ACTN|nr:MBL fold metallo-hydrolase [Kribbella shirazensis]NIK59492.1 glyoxylase-like metal-dependent hydrolase (beta-lactamase superfamily II) [Kribbella shirazensis]
MPDYPYADPVVELTDLQEIARDVVVIPNRNVDLVPNIGLIGGTRAVLVVDTGLGPRNARKVLEFATAYAAGRRLYLTTTHFHPEHAFGADVFAGEATYLLNRAQADDLTTKGEGYLAMFRQLGEPVARELTDARIPAPDLTYDGTHELDLGGRVVRLRPTGRAHSKGDQVVTVPDAAVLFTGDLAEAGQFAIFPWFPPYDVDVSGVRWIEVMNRLIEERPRVVVPGHGDIGDAGLLTQVRDYLTELRDETWRRRDSSLPEATIAAEIRDLMIRRHPDWRLPEWIERGVGCLCTERPA